MKRATGIIALGLLLIGAEVLSGRQDCYSVVAGRLATADGSVMMAHNEDNGLKYLARLRKVERRVHSPGGWFELEGGGRIPQADTTFAYWFLEMPGLGYSHALLNEHGVAVVSDNCPSREDRSDLTAGGIGPALRILAAERCRTARQAVKLVGGLVERFGYKASGRTLVICDTREGWLLAMVRGRHWAAARVPDDQVAVIANSYTIRRVDLADTLNFLGSADLIDYAASRGWYEPDSGEPFDFERAFAEPGRRVSPHQRFRQWSGIRHLAAELIPSPENGVPLPFSLKPARRVRAEHLFAILRDHYEDSPYEVSPYRPHNPEKPLKARVICANSTNSGSVFVLRGDMPLEIGALWWLALCRPCTGPFLPLYLGLARAPEPLYFEVEPGVYREPASAAPLPANKAYRVFRDLTLAVDRDYAGRIGKVRPVWTEFERTSFTIQQALEQEVRSNWYGNRQFLMETVERICQGTVARAVQQARALTEEF